MAPSTPYFIAFLLVSSFVPLFWAFQYRQDANERYREALKILNHISLPLALFKDPQGSGMIEASTVLNQKFIVNFTAKGPNSQEAQDVSAALAMHIAHAILHDSDNFL